MDLHQAPTTIFSIHLTHMEPDGLMDGHGASLYTAHVQASAGHEQERLEQLQSYQKQIHQTLNQLQQLPKKLNHNICVPYGRHAFFQGTLQHTNEVRVHLGAGYYLHCTAHEARGILERRLQRLQVSVDASQKLLEEKQGRLQAFESALVPGQGPDGEGVMEIRQSYEESEALLATSAQSAAKRAAAAPTLITAPASSITPTFTTTTTTTTTIANNCSRSSSTGGEALPWANTSLSEPSLPTQQSSTQVQGSVATGPSSRVKGGPKDPEMDRLFAHMDDLIRMEEVEAEEGEGQEEGEEGQEGNRHTISKGSRSGRFVGSPQSSAEPIREPDSDDEDEEEAEEEEDWASAFTPVSMPLDSKSTVVAAPLTHHPQPAQPSTTHTSSSHGIAAPTSTANKPATGLKKGFLSRPAHVTATPTTTSSNTSVTSATASAKAPFTTTSQPWTTSTVLKQHPTQPLPEDPGEKAACLAAGRVAAFTGQVVERAPPAMPAPMVSTPVMERGLGLGVGVSSSTSSGSVGKESDEGRAGGAPAKVSKFKQMRQKTT